MIVPYIVKGTIFDDRNKEKNESKKRMNKECKRNKRLNTISSSIYNIGQVRDYIQDRSLHNQQALLTQGSTTEHA